MRLSRDPAARRRLAALVAAALAALIAGFVVGASNDGGSPAPERAAPAAERDPAARLSLRQQVGQLTVSSFDGAEAPDWLARRLRAGDTAGVILFGGNVVDENGLRALTHSLQDAARGGALVAADQEGGDIRTVTFAGPEEPQPDQRDPARVAGEAGRALRGAGVNVNLAPVADVAVAPTSVMAGRAFAGDAAAVSASVGGAVRGLRSAGVAATAKHFPGLGEASANTDDASVTIDASGAELRQRDLPPFEAAIRERVPLVMLGHAVYPALDEDRIASQSPAIARDLLRGDLGFDGVAVTDSMEAQAVLDRGSVGDAAVRSIAAGADLLLLTGSGSWNEVFPRLLRRARRDPAFRERVAEAAGRVLRLKRTLGLRTRP